MHRNRTRAAWIIVVTAGWFFTGAAPGQVAAPAPRAPVPSAPIFRDLYAANLGITYRIEPYGGGIGARLTQHPTPGSAAAQIQLEPGDFITHLDGMALFGPNDVLNHVGRTTVQFVNIRTGRPQVGVVWISQGGPVPNPPPPPITYTLGVNVIVVTLPGGPVYAGYVAPAPVYGLQITGLTAGMPAQQAGLEVGDVILSINGRNTTNVGDLRAALAASNGHANIVVRNVRNGQNTVVPVWLGPALPPGTAAAPASPAPAPPQPGAVSPFAPPPASSP